MLVAGNAKPGNNYCIGGNNELTNKEIVLEICQIMEKLRPSNKPYIELIKYVEDRPGHDLRYAINFEKDKKEFGWKPKYDFSYNLEKTVKWYLDNILWCENLTHRTGYSWTKELANKNEKSSANLASIFNILKFNESLTF